MGHWYLLRNGIEFGPFSDEQIIKQLATDRLTGNDRLKGPGFPGYVSPQVVRKQLGITIQPFAGPDIPMIEAGSLGYPSVPVPSVGLQRRPRAIGLHRRYIWSMIRHHWAIVGASALLLIMTTVVLTAIWHARLTGHQRGPSSQVSDASEPSSTDTQRPDVAHDASDSPESDSLAEGTIPNNGDDQANPTEPPSEVAGSSDRLSTTVYQRALPAVPLVEPLPRSGSGSGFVVSFNDRWYLVTNRHVVRHASQGLKLTFFHYRNNNLSVSGTINLPRTAIEIVGKHSDIAIVSMDRVPAQMRARIQPLPLSVSGPRVGEHVFVIGHPGLPGDSVLEAHLTTGNVSGPSRRLNFAAEAGLVFPMTAAINPGNSGGPVLDGEGHVVGICTLKIPTNEEGQPLDSLFFAVDVREVRALLTGDQPRLSKKEVAALLEDPPFPRLSEGTSDDDEEDLWTLRVLAHLKLALDRGFAPFTGDFTTSVFDIPSGESGLDLPALPGGYLVLYFARVLQPRRMPIIRILDADNYDHATVGTSPDGVVAAWTARNWEYPVLPMRLYVRSSYPAFIVVLHRQ